MPRYADWFRKVGDTAASPRALDAAKKLLGYLNIRRGTPGVETLAQKVTLDDGTVVTAAFYGDQPTVTVDTSAVGGETCTLYVESGMLDLGPNIASDANNRFNRGLPEFDDRPATLYFGDGVDCESGKGGFNGRIKVRGKTITSECLPKQGRSVDSRLRDPVKKQAQALLPASCWSGLMQRYVQAVYGGDALDYSATATALTIEGKTFDVKDSWGLVDIGGTLRFVKIAGGIAQFYKVKPTTPCFAAVLKAWREMPNTPQQRQNRDRILTVALSGCVVGSEDGPPVAVPNDTRRFVSDRAAFVFHPELPKAIGVVQLSVVEDENRSAVVFELTAGLDDGVPTLSKRRLESAPMLENLDLIPKTVIGSPFAGGGQGDSAFDRGDYTLHRGDRYDLPIYATYGSDGLADIVRFSMVIEDDSPVADYGLCNLGSGIEIPVAAISDNNVTYSCSGLPPEYRMLDFVSGVYARNWSTVRARKQLARVRDNAELVLINNEKIAFASVFVDFGTIHSDVVSTSDTVSGLSSFSYMNVPYSGNLSKMFQYITCAATYDSGVASEQFRFPDDCDGFKADTCDKRYIWSAAAGTVTINITREWWASSTNMLSGRLHAACTSVVSLCWGASDAFACDEYEFSGSSGLFYSVVHNRGPSQMVNEASFTFDVSVDVRVETAVVPGGFCNGHDGNTLSTEAVHLTGSTGTLYSITHPIANAERVPTAADLPPFAADWSASRTEGGDCYPEIVFRGTESRRFTVASSGATEMAGGVVIDVERGDVDYPEGAPVAVKHDYLGNAVGGNPYVPYTKEEEDAISPNQLYYLLGMQAIEDNHQSAVFEDGGDEETFARRVGIQGKSFVVSPYMARTSLLNAKTRPAVALSVGASINMDRETITGGYPKVSTSSFVGWA